MTPANSPRSEPCDYPLRLEAIFVERVWGSPYKSEEVTFLYPVRPNRPQRIGEVWLTGNDNRVANGAFAGSTLQELTRLCSASLIGQRAVQPHPSGETVFPLLVKFLFTTDKLSVQVHPPDSCAREREASWGKTEMWHILRAAPGARLAVGFRKDVPEKVRLDRQAFRRTLETGAIEEMLNWMQVQAGDTFFVPAGTVHAIGPGLVLCEIQQNSDITYRLYDYNRPGTDGRPRPLHVDQALDVMQWHTEGGRTAPVELPAEAGARQVLAACPYFATEKWTLRQAFTRQGKGRLEIWIGLEGNAEFAIGNHRVACSKGQVVVVPADVRSFVLRPQSPCVFLRTFPPDLESDILAPMRARGVTEEQLRGVYFPMSQIVERAAP